jgi:hypothetical protein
MTNSSYSGFVLAFTNNNQRQDGEQKQHVLELGLAMAIEGMYFEEMPPSVSISPKCILVAVRGTSAQAAVEVLDRFCKAVPGYDLVPSCAIAYGKLEVVPPDVRPLSKYASFEGRPAIFASRIVAATSNLPSGSLAIHEDAFKFFVGLNCDFKAIEVEGKRDERFSVRVTQGYFSSPSLPASPAICPLPTRGKPGVRGTGKTPSPIHETGRGSPRLHVTVQSGQTVKEFLAPPSLPLRDLLSASARSGPLPAVDVRCPTSDWRRIEPSGTLCGANVPTGSWLRLQEQASSKAEE